MLSKIIIAIDGYSGCGKSTLARELAREIGFRHIDSGAMYRATTFYFMKHGVDVHNYSMVDAAIASLNLSFEIDFEGKTVLYLSDELMTDQLRTPEVNALVSDISAIPSVRSHLVSIQQELGREGAIVMDGRDIGSVVFPDAALKIFLTARLDKRVERRHSELLRKGRIVSDNDIEQNLKHRDHIDSTRNVSPLIQTKDAVLIDNTNLSRSEQLAMVLALTKERAQ